MRCSFAPRPFEGALMLAMSLLAGPMVAAQEPPVHVCIYQVKGTEAPTNNPQYDAVKLQQELSKEKLPDGASIDAIVVINPKEKTTGAGGEMEEGCAYRVKIWRHAALNTASTDAMGSAGPVPFDLNTVDFELSESRTRKVLLRGSERQTTIFVKQGRRMFVPYPVIAKKINAKLAQVRPRE